MLQNLLKLRSFSEIQPTLSVDLFSQQRKKFSFNKIPIGTLNPPFEINVIKAEFLLTSN